MAKYSVQEFAELIKTKYPDYAEMDDLELTKSIVSKYPEYETQIDFETDTEPQIDFETDTEPVEGDDKKKKKKSEPVSSTTIPKSEPPVLSPAKQKQQDAIEAVYQKNVQKIKNTNLSIEQQEKQLSDLLKTTNKIKNKYKLKGDKKSYVQELFDIDTEGPGEELMSTWEQEGASLRDKELFLSTDGMSSSNKEFNAIIGKAKNNLTQRNEIRKQKRLRTNFNRNC